MRTPWTALAMSPMDVPGLPAAILLFLLAGPGTAQAQWVKSDAPDGRSIDALAASNGILFAGANIGTAAGQVLASGDSGAHWDTVSLDPALTAIFDIDAAGDLVIVGTYESGALLSTNGGLSWAAEFDTGIAPGVFAAAVAGENFIALTNLGVQSFLSTDSGASWDRIDTGAMSLEYGASDFFTSGPMVYAGTYRGLFRSSDRGATWERPANAGLFTNTDGSTYLHRIIEHRGVVVAAQGNGVSFSTDTGVAWTNVPLDFGMAAYVSSFAAIGDTIFAGLQSFVPGDDWGVMYTLDSGRTWAPLNDGWPPGTSVLSLRVVGGRLVAGTFGDGIWHRGPLVPPSSPVRIAVRQGWNLLSLLAAPPDPSAVSIVPGALAGPFRYDGGYVKDSLMVTGRGYWVKFGAAETLAFQGPGLASDTIDVVEGWNLIGGIGMPVPIGEVVRIPPEMSLHGPYRFDAGYQKSESIQPGSGCWIRADRGGKLVLGGPE